MSGHLERMLEAEEDRIMEDLALGEITNAEASRALADLRQSFNDEVERLAEQARDDVLNEYGFGR